MYSIWQVHDSPLIAVSLIGCKVRTDLVICCNMLAAYMLCA